MTPPTFERLKSIGMPFIVAAVFLVLWEIGAPLIGIPDFLLPRPSQIIRAFAGDPYVFLSHASVTLLTTVAGFFIAVVLGVAMAVAIVQSKLIEQTLYTGLVALNSVPKVAVAPLFIVWMGTGIDPKIAIAAMIAVFAIVIDMVHGLKSVDPEMLDLGRSARASTSKIIFKIRFPHSLPSLFAGMKVGISLALIGAIVGEFVAANRGLGYLIMVAQGQFDVARMFAAILVLSAMGLLLFYAIVGAERLLLPWHVSIRHSSVRAGA